MFTKDSRAQLENENPNHSQRIIRSGKRRNEFSIPGLLYVANLFPVFNYLNQLRS